MVVITLSNCPPKLRGDLSKWLLEISTGVYAGHINAKVRENLWDRICKHLSDGRATMVWSTSGEQHMDFAVHNSLWKPRDYDGIKLIWHPAESNCDVQIDSIQPNLSQQDHKTERLRTVSHNAVQKAADNCEKAKDSCCIADDYVILDFETTGFSYYKDEIIEVGALRILESKPAGEYHALLTPSRGLPRHIAELTGLTMEELESNGRPLEQVIEELLDFIGGLTLAGHNVSFDYRFLQAACKRLNLNVPPQPSIDSLIITRSKVSDANSFKLSALVNHFHIDVQTKHRALADCYATYYLLMKLKEL